MAAFEEDVHANPRKLLVTWEVRLRFHASTPFPGKRDWQKFIRRQKDGTATVKVTQLSATSAMRANKQYAPACALNHGQRCLRAATIM